MWIQIATAASKLPVLEGQRLAVEAQDVGAAPARPLEHLLRHVDTHDRPAQPLEHGNRHARAAAEVEQPPRAGPEQPLERVHLGRVQLGPEVLEPLDVLVVARAVAHAIDRSAG